MTDPVGLAAFGGGAWLLKEMLGPSAKILGEEIADRFRGFLGDNSKSMLERAALQVRASGQKAGEVPLRLLIPILERAGFEDDPSLQERWAALLANAATSDDPRATPPAFVSILAQLTPDAAAILELVWRREHLGVKDKEPSHWGVAAKHVARHMQFEMGDLIGRALNEDEVSLAFTVAQAAGLLDREPVMRPINGAFSITDQTEYRVTDLGALFIAACTPTTGRV
jgi:hypothetical protein